MQLEIQPLLDDRGVSLEQLAEGTGLPKGKLQKALDGDVKAVRLSTIEALCNFFDVGPGEFIK